MAGRSSGVSRARSKVYWLPTKLKFGPGSMPVVISNRFSGCIAIDRSEFHFNDRVADLLAIRRLVQRDIYFSPSLERTLRIGTYGSSSAAFSGQTVRPYLRTFFGPPPFVE